MCWNLTGLMKRKSHAHTGGDLTAKLRKQSLHEPSTISEPVGGCRAPGISTAKDTAANTGGGTLALYASGTWAIGSIHMPTLDPTPEEAQLCHAIDKLRAELLPRCTPPQHPGFYLDPRAGEERRLGIACRGFRVNGKESIAQSSVADTHSLRVLISHEEHHLLGLLNGTQAFPVTKLPFIHVATLSHGDIVVTRGKGDQLVWAIERKREDDLLSGIESRSFQSQRASFSNTAARADQVEYLVEKLPRWASGATVRRVREKWIVIENARNRSICRDGFRWSRCSSILHTVYTILARIRGILAVGLHPHHSEGSAGAVLVRPVQADNPPTQTLLPPGGGAFAAPGSSPVSLPMAPLVQKLPIQFRGARSATSVTPENFLPATVALVPGASFYQGLGIQEHFGTVRDLCRELEEFYAEVSDSIDVMDGPIQPPQPAVRMLTGIKWASECLRKKYGTVVPEDKKPRINRKVATALISALGFM